MKRPKIMADATVVEAGFALVHFSIDEGGRPATPAVLRQQGNSYGLRR
ncbi:MAG: hypothetical protein Q4C87_01375 [Actinomycetaceae bacterium]|nr:hypothetical protein [Actinomycetaceae bacterium]